MARVPFPEREWDQAKLRQIEENERKANLFLSFLNLARLELDSSNGNPAREYLCRRGFSKTQIEELGFGLYTSPSDIKAKLLKRGFSENEIHGSGILGIKNPEKHSWDALSGRIVGVFSQHYGQVRSVWAGYVNQRPPKDGPPPYITIGQKSIPFGMDEARRLGKKDLLLVEGPIKALLPYSLGLDDPFPIASGGDLSNDQIKTLEGYLRSTGSLTINWDYDSEAKDGVHGKTLKTLDRLANVPFRVYIINPVSMVRGQSN